MFKIIVFVTSIQNYCDCDYGLNSKLLIVLSKLKLLYIMFGLKIIIVLIQIQNYCSCGLDSKLLRLLFKFKIIIFITPIQNYYGYCSNSK
jgi:hypothetical protein